MKPLLHAIQWTLIGLGAATVIIACWVVAGGDPGLRRVASAAHPAPPRGHADAVALAAPAVVSVQTTSRRVSAENALTADPLFQRFFAGAGASVRRETSLGSGVILDAAGIVLTNYHVIKGADSIQVMLRDGRDTPARVVGSDPETDLAVLRIELDALPVITLGDSEALRVGDIVLAIGNPFGIGQTVTQGIVSATGRNRVGINTFESFIQTDAAINVGNSGGALIDNRGALVGINTARIESDGIGFAIPSGLAVDIARQLLDHGSVQRGWLGIDARDHAGPAATHAAGRGGILVLDVLEAGPAARAGVRRGDVITHIGGRAITGSRDAVERIAAVTPGSRIELTLLREGRRLAADAVVSRRPLPP
ncbi:MAG: trypsin-like peptidase domain-containing protein [Gammaproteobacteria bacterium]